MRRRSNRRLPDRVWLELEDADLVLHAGDIVTGEVLDELSGFAPVHAVLGNNDRDLVAELPETLEVQVEGLRIAMVHDSGPRAGREARLLRRFPGADVVVFGHSHIPVDAPGARGQWLVNPGSPTERRRQPHHTIATLDVEDGRLVGHRIVVVDP